MILMLAYNLTRVMNIVGIKLLMADRRVKRPARAPLEPLKRPLGPPQRFHTTKTLNGHGLQNGSRTRVTVGGLPEFGS
jgi:hypothetical protein